MYYSSDKKREKIWCRNRVFGIFLCLPTNTDLMRLLPAVFAYIILLKHVCPNIWQQIAFQVNLGL